VFQRRANSLIEVHGIQIVQTGEQQPIATDSFLESGGFSKAQHDDIFSPCLVVRRKELLDFMKTAPYVFSRHDIKRGKLYMPTHVLQMLIDQQEPQDTEKAPNTEKASAQLPTPKEKPTAPPHFPRLPILALFHVQNFLQAKKDEEAFVVPSIILERQNGLGLLETVFADSVEPAPRHRVVRGVGQVVLWGGLAAVLGTGIAAALEETQTEHTGTGPVKVVSFVRGTVANMYDSVSAQTEGMQPFVPPMLK
jgi:hypothetical protein